MGESDKGNVEDGQMKVANSDSTHLPWPREIMKEKCGTNIRISIQIKTG